MRLTLEQVEETVKQLDYVEEVHELNDRLRRGLAEFQLPDGLVVRMEYYRVGEDVYLDGTLSGAVRGVCARCAEAFTFDLAASVRTVLAPRPHGGLAGRETADEDLGLSFYEGDEIDVTEVVYEQALLSLPTRAVCAESCRGLCVQCGANLNAGPCGCGAFASSSPFRRFRGGSRQPM